MSDSPNERLISLIRTGDLVRARELAQDLLKEDPQHRESHRALGICSFRERDYPAAEKRFRDLIGWDPQAVDDRYYLALILERTGRNAEAIQQYERVAHLDPANDKAVARLRALRPPAPSLRPPVRSEGPAPEGAAAESLAKMLEDPHFDIARMGAPGPWRYRLWRSFILHLLAAAVALGYGLFGLIVRTDPTLRQRQLAVLAIGAAVALLGYTMLGRHTFRFRVYPLHLAVEQGVLYRRREIVWFYKLLEVEYLETPLLSLAGTACLTMSVEGQAARRIRFTASPQQRMVSLVGFGSPAEILAATDEIRILALQQRRSLKMSFI
jgi:tetratricopeptide (TPR) repeat protein